MADKMDALLTALGQEANEQVDFDGAFAQILAQHQQQAQAAPQPRRRWRAWRGTLSMAAGMVVVLGTVLIAGQSGLFNAKGAAPQAAPAEASMYAADAEAEMDVTAEAPAAEIPAAMPLPSSSSATNGVQYGFVNTALKPYARARTQAFSISLRVASGARTV